MPGTCPYCDEEVTPHAGGEPQGHAGVATVWICPVCNKILGITEWLD